MKLILALLATGSSASYMKYMKHRHHHGKHHGHQHEDHVSLIQRSKGNLLKRKLHGHERTSFLQKQGKARVKARMIAEAKARVMSLMQEAAKMGVLPAKFFKTPPRNDVMDFMRAEKFSGGHGGQQNADDLVDPSSLMRNGAIPPEFFLPLRSYPKKGVTNDFARPFVLFQKDYPPEMFDDDIKRWNIFGQNINNLIQKSKAKYKIGEKADVMKVDKAGADAAIQEAEKVKEKNTEEAKKAAIKEDLKKAEAEEKKAEAVEKAAEAEEKKAEAKEKQAEKKAEEKKEEKLEEEVKKAETEEKEAEEEVE